MTTPPAKKPSVPWLNLSADPLDDCFDALDQLDDVADSDLEDILCTAQRVADGESFD
jgi:hypothetical protein